MIIRHGVFVMNTTEQAFVGDEEQRHAWGFVNATTLCLDDAVFDLISHAQAVAPTNGVRLVHEVDDRSKFFSIYSNRATLDKLDQNIFRSNSDRLVPKTHSHDGLD